VSEYDLRTAFPLNGKEFTINGEVWICELVEVSDLGSDPDRLSWYLIFRAPPRKHGNTERIRRLEIVTSADVASHKSWKPDLAQRVSTWLLEGGEDDRVEWLTG
jgi:hypothetical protein